MDLCRERGVDLGPFDHEEIDPEVDAPPFGHAIEEGRMSVEHTVLIVTSYPDRVVGRGNLVEEILRKTRDVVDVEVGQLAVGVGEVENDQAPDPEIEWNDRGDLVAMSLEEVAGKGTVVWRTTHNLGGDLSPTLLSDGRVLYSAGQRGALALMAMSWAGENLNPFYGSHDGLVSQIDASETPYFTHWEVLDLARVQRGTPTEFRIILDALEQAPEGIAVSMVPQPGPEEEPHIVELADVLAGG